MSITLRKSVRRLEVRQFVFWMSAALIGGAVPDMLMVLGVAYLLLLWGVAIGVALWLWTRDRRRVGIAVVVSLPDSAGSDDTTSLVDQIDRWMKDKHRGWFRSGPENAEIKNSPAARASWAIDTIRHRLRELDAPHGDSTVYLYLYCRQEESFHLGRSSAAVWSTESRLLTRGSDQGPDATLSLVVRYISTYKRRDEAQYYEIDLSQRRIAEIDSGNVESVDLRKQMPAGAAFPRRLALAVFAAEDSGRIESFRTGVLEAATGGTDHGYMVAEGDLCDRAMFVSIAPAALKQALTTGGAQQFMYQIDKAWRARAKEWYGSDEVELSLFIQGPSIVAFAAGAILPDTAKLIAWRQPARVPVSGQPEQRVFAIIDGDDVGSGMELHFLRNELDQALQYSSAVARQIDATIRGLSSLPGVDAISQAGDSAIFTVTPTALRNFHRRVEDLRAQSSFKFSCGTGDDVRSAYTALRLAKASGKNVSRGVG